MYLLTFTASTVLDGSMYCMLGYQSRKNRIDIPRPLFLGVRYDMGGALGKRTRREPVEGALHTVF
jgi:hypothetical protein